MHCTSQLQSSSNVFIASFFWCMSSRSFRRPFSSIVTLSMGCDKVLSRVLNLLQWMSSHFTECLFHLRQAASTLIPLWSHWNTFLFIHLLRSKNALLQRCCTVEGFNDKCFASSDWFQFKFSHHCKAFWMPWFQMISHWAEVFTLHKQSPCELWRPVCQLTDNIIVNHSACQHHSQWSKLEQIKFLVLGNCDLLLQSMMRHIIVKMLKCTSGTHHHDWIGLVEWQTNLWCPLSVLEQKFCLNDQPTEQWQRVETLRQSISTVEKHFVKHQCSGCVVCTSCDAAVLFCCPFFQENGGDQQVDFKFSIEQPSVKQVLTAKCTRLINARHLMDGKHSWVCQWGRSVCCWTHAKPMLNPVKMPHWSLSFKLLVLIS